jgi:hypothetical protein
MTLEAWTVLVVAAAFLLLGIAISPLGWVAMRDRRTRFEQLMERRQHEAAKRLAALEHRLVQLESAASGRARKQKRVREGTVPHGPHWQNAIHGWPKRDDAIRSESELAPTLITVPGLSPPPNEREASIEGMTHRYSAIWSMADSGASPDAIARATGQPVGQVELILGLRRQIDAHRTKLSHDSET